MTLLDKNLMQRCFDLARLGLGKVSPNPIVGSVISTPNKILGEGCHKSYGNEHAEVNAVLSVKEKNRKKIRKSLLSVSLEPCNFHGNTPACTDLIIAQEIPTVNISTIDRTSQVNSAGLEKLRENGKQVNFGIKETKGKFIARIRNTFVTKNRPYIILKYAQSKDGFIGQKGKQIWLSNFYTKRLVHKWRSEVSAIIAGTNTVLVDDPELTTRFYPGKSPIRVLIDKTGKIPAEANVKSDQSETWIYTYEKDKADAQTTKHFLIDSDETILSQICTDLHSNGSNTLLVEGGARLLNTFIEADLWDEVRIITAPKILKEGISAPSLKGISIQKFDMHTDVIQLVLNPNNVIYS